MFSFMHHQSRKDFFLRFVFLDLHMMQDSCQQQSSYGKSYLFMLFSEDDRFCLFFSIFMFSIFFQGVFIFMAIDKPYSSALQLNLFDDSFYVSSLSSLHVIHYWLHSRREYISNIHVLFILLFTLRILFQISQVSLVYCYQCVTY